MGSFQEKSASIYRLVPRIVIKIRRGLRFRSLGKRPNLIQKTTILPDVFLHHFGPKLSKNKNFGPILDKNIFWRIYLWTNSVQNWFKTNFPGQFLTEVFLLQILNQFWAELVQRYYHYNKGGGGVSRKNEISSYVIKVRSLRWKKFEQVIKICKQGKKSMFAR